MDKGTAEFKGSMVARDGLIEIQGLGIRVEQDSTWDVVALRAMGEDGMMVTRAVRLQTEYLGPPLEGPPDAHLLIRIANGEGLDLSTDLGGAVFKVWEPAAGPGAYEAAIYYRNGEAAYISIDLTRKALDLWGD